MSDIFSTLLSNDQIPLINDFDKDLFLISVSKASEQRQHASGQQQLCDIFPVHGAYICILNILVHTGGIKSHMSVPCCIELNNKSKEWLLLPDMNNPRCYHSMVALNPLVIYVIGGIEFNCLKTKPVDVTEKYYVYSKKWIPSAALNKPRERPSTCSTNQRYIYAFGGTNKSEIHSTYEVLDTLNEDKGWKIFDLPHKMGVYNIGAAQIKQKSIILFGGRNSNSKLKESYILSTADNTWEVGPPLLRNAAFRNESITVYRDKVTGVADNKKIYLHIYDTKKNKWEKEEVKRWNKIEESIGKRKFNLLLEENSIDMMD